MNIQLRVGYVFVHSTSQRNKVRSLWIGDMYETHMIF